MMPTDEQIKAQRFDALMEILAPKKPAPKKKFDHETAVMKYKTILLNEALTKNQK